VSSAGRLRAAASEKLLTVGGNLFVSNKSRGLPMSSKIYMQLRMNLRTLLILTPFMLASVVLTFIVLAATDPVAAGGLLQSPLSPGFSAGSSPLSPGLSPSSPLPEQPVPPKPPAPTGPALAPTAPGASAAAGGSSALIMWIVIGLIIGIGIVVGALALQQRPE
jgi:hypothetical protein